MTKSAGNYGFGHILMKQSLMEYFIFCAVEVIVNNYSSLKLLNQQIRLMICHRTYEFSTEADVTKTPCSR